MTAQSVEDPRALVLRRLTKEYRRGQPVLDGIDLVLPGSGLTAIIGPSGTGKSTLIRCVNRWCSDLGRNPVPRRGSCEIVRARLAQRAAAHRHGVPGIQSGRTPDRDGEPTVRPARLRSRRGARGCASFPPEDIARAFDLLDAVDCLIFATRRADALSGGQRQRVGIARAIMQEPEIILADEPTSSLDPKTSVEIMEILSRFAAERGIPVIVNIHNVELARRFARAWSDVRRAVVYDGSPQGLSEAHLKQIYGGENGWNERRGKSIGAAKAVYRQLGRAHRLVPARAVSGLCLRAARLFAERFAAGSSTASVSSRACSRRISPAGS